MMTVVFVLLIDNIYEKARIYFFAYDEALLMSIVSIFDLQFILDKNSQRHITLVHSFDPYYIEPPLSSCNVNMWSPSHFWHNLGGVFGSLFHLQNIEVARKGIWETIPNIYYDFKRTMKPIEVTEPYAG